MDDEGSIHILAGQATEGGAATKILVNGIDIMARLSDLETRLDALQNQRFVVAAPRPLLESATRRILSLEVTRLFAGRDVWSVLMACPETGEFLDLVLESDMTTRNLVVLSNTSLGAAYIRSADLDGDGDLDVLTASRLDDTVAWFEQDPVNRTFERHIITTSAEFVVSAEPVDLDGDGDLDVVSASVHDNTIAWYRNDIDSGQGFSAGLIVSNTAGGPWAVQAADLDGDGDQDLISANFYNGTVSWYTNHRLGTSTPPSFSSHILGDGAYGAISALVGDLDSDGLPDIVVGCAYTRYILWYRNLGQGTFDMAQRIPTAAFGTNAVRAWDVDNDGDLDLLGASTYGDQLSWYRNLGNGTFTEVVIDAAADGVRDVMAADLDGDGVLELVAALREGQQLLYYNVERWA
ncbi:uncharacterized protein MONBRDRAFT_28819 [Monosiga brevicollis MX1]|uniref:VCBS repeat-containing protein n=1 Tax=Monosiga brevicollis TaxID=81824 RepID=A9V9I7_MONBE|nr:uncharacterized protein MONBRDRAFT_28819 [Monosiga brevicollis MX1]EDQ85802.1 predicted protein [Monosiga brevicollis MX1]|eukprot:XP_001749281.1 hypothetical protein [Monosiga brevicollis MX1]